MGNWAGFGEAGGGCQEISENRLQRRYVQVNMSTKIGKMGIYMQKMMIFGEIYLFATSGLVFQRLPNEYINKKRNQ